ncbi:hypothetical protein KAZ92_02430 [Candidatus Gracilibacteria bacterium]|nr:hypothetical protein [Candidatus Gracilibacteria bacterium]
MHLRGNETIQKIYRRHYFPFVFSAIKTLAASFPFYFLIFVLQQSISKTAFYMSLGLVTIFFVLVFMYVSFIYWADKLVVTNFRVIFVDWKLLNLSSENEAEIHDIQDIHIVDKGILSAIPFLNYGTLTIATAASEISVRFTSAPDPDQIKRFIFSVK